MLWSSEERKMLRIYLLIVVLGILGGVGYGAKYYYDTTQAKLARLQENNAKLEGALETSEASINQLQQNMAKFAEANKQLQADLQKAEAYGDDLRAKLRKHDLTALALREPGQLEGKMNGATANLWRDLEQDTGGAGDDPLPEWLQRPSEPTAGDQDGNTGGEGTDPDSGETETSQAD